MSIVPPIINPIDLSGYPSAYRDYPSVQPFSTRSALTYQQKLEGIAAWIPQVLVPYLSENFQGLDDALTDQINTLSATVQTALNDQATTVNQELADTLAGIVSGANSSLNNQTILAALEAANSTVTAWLDGRYAPKSTADNFDTLTSANVSNTASATTGALSKRYAKVAALHHDFANSGNGAAPTTLDSGHTVVETGTFLATVNGGALYQPSGSGANAVSYLNATTTRNVRRIGAEFTVESATDSGALCMAVWQSTFTTPIPPAGVHFVTTSTTWQVGPYLGQSGGGFVPVANFTYKTPLQAGITYRVEIEIDVDRGHATVKLPDGTVFEYDDPKISQYAGNNPTWEHLSGVGTSTDIPVHLLRLWADDDPQGEYTGLRRSTPQNLTAGQYDPQASKSTTLSGSFQVVDSVSITVPASKRVWLHGQECLQFGGTAVNTYVQTDVNGGTTYGFAQWLGLLSQDGAYHFDGILNLGAFTVGQVVTVNVSILAGTAAHHQHNDSANMRNGILAIPLP